MSIKKKLSDEDIKYWLALTKTLDSKKYNHLKKQNFCDANDTYFQKKLDLEKNLIFKKEKVIKKLDEKKYFRDVILEDIRIDKKKLNLLKRGKLEPEIILDLHGMNTVIAKKNCRRPLIKSFINLIYHLKKRLTILQSVNINFIN